MKLLLDQNLSYRLCEILEGTFPDISHISFLGMKKAFDYEIWEYARDKEFVLVTQDADFYDFSLLYGAPPQIIWLRVGNLRTEEIAEILKANKANIKRFVEDKNLSCLQLY